jgi:hypothetical protein
MALREGLGPPPPQQTFVRWNDPYGTELIGINRDGTIYSFGLRFPDGSIQTTSSGIAGAWSSLTGDLTEIQVIPWNGPTIGIPDTFISRSAAGVIAIGTSPTPGDTSGSLILSNIIVSGITAGRGGGNIGSNTVFGNLALENNTTGNSNVAIGLEALQANTTGVFNVAVGYQCLLQNTTGSYNVGVGENFYGNITGSDNTAIGYEALEYNVSGNENTGLGYWALYTNISGSHNTAVGWQSLVYNLSGDENTAIGFASLFSNTTGIRNAGIGSGALGTNVTGSYLSALGYQADVSIDGLTDSVAIGNEAKITASHQIVLGGSTVTSVITNGVITAPTVILTASSTPTSAHTQGTAGQFAWDTTNLYFCSVSGPGGGATQWNKVTYTPIA